jgi:DHA2 family multidrug resistance protein
MDARWPIAVGLMVMAAGCYWMALMNLQISPGQVVGPRMVLTLGLGLLFAPMSVAAYKYTPVHLRGAAVGLLSLLRTEGGSAGTSLAQIIQERREQFHLSRLVEGLTPLNHHVQGFLGKTRDFFLQRTGDSSQSSLLSLNALDQLRQQQAASLAFFDVFWLSAVVAAVLVLLVALMKRSVAEKGEHIGGE